MTTAVALGLSAAFVGCAPQPTFVNDWSLYSGPGAEHFRKEEVIAPDIPDPFEATNRIGWSLTDFLLFDVVAPVSRGWRLLVPPPVRRCLVNAAHNLAYPIRAVSDLLQGEFDHAGEETRRFLVNSTLGVLGLFDVAGGPTLEPTEEDIGRAFVKWGWEDSTYLVWPVLGPSTTRDTLGLAGDVLLDPLTYIAYFGIVRTFIVGSEQIGAAKQFARTNYDPYLLARLAWTANRSPLRLTGEPLEQDPFADEVLKAVRFRCDDPEFPGTARTHHVRVPTSGRKLPYELWLQPKPAPMVYLLPGMGAHRRSGTTVGAAEAAYQRGFSVMAISSPLNFDSVARALSAAVPGFTPTDAHDVHITLDSIDRDVEKRYPGRVTGRVLMGLSLGATYALYIAAAESDPQCTLMRFDRYLALSPPVDLSYAAETLDRFYNAPLVLNREDRAPWIRHALAKATRVSLNDVPLARSGLAFSRLEAEFLLGLSFRWSLHDLIRQTQKAHDMGVLKTPMNSICRSASSREILEFSHVEYYYAFVYPYHRLQRGETRSAEEMLAAADLRSLSGRYPVGGKVRVFVNHNDFLLTPEHVAWLAEEFGVDHVSIETAGGHLGVLFDPGIRRRIMDSLDDVRPAPLPRGD